MDIRVVNESIFDIDSDCIIYFVDNAFSNNDTMEIISNAGDRILDVFSKLSSFFTGEFKVIPAFNLKSLYIAISCIPKKIETQDDEDFLESIFYKIFDEIFKYEFNTIAIDLTRLSNNYSSKHSDIFKKVLRDIKNDFVVYICK